MNKYLIGINFRQNSEAICLGIGDRIVLSMEQTIQPSVEQRMSKDQAQIQQRSRRMKTKK